MLRTNARDCVIKAVLGAVSHPRIALKNPYLVDPSGAISVLPGTGGITYNVKVGDSAICVAGDHIEPGASVTLEDKERDGTSLGALSILTCIGNEARVVTGEAMHARGTVTGKHGGVEHIIIDFEQSVLEKLVIGDRIQIRSLGQGLRLIDVPGVHVMSVDPALLGKMGIVIRKGIVVVPVAHVIPASIMGSGMGSRHSFSGDFDIQLSDTEAVKRHGLEKLRLGDIVAILDADCRFGRSIRDGAVSIGVVAHASCVVGGHGPGVTVIMATERNLIVPEIDPDANIARYLGIGLFREEAAHRSIEAERRPGIRSRAVRRGRAVGETAPKRRRK